METLGPFKGVYKDITPIMENQMEKKMKWKLVYIGDYRDQVFPKYWVPF